MATGTVPTRPSQSADSERTVGRKLFLFVMTLLAAFILWQGFIFLRDTTAPQWINAIIATVWGVGGMLILFYIASAWVEQLSPTWQKRATPLVFVGPAVALLMWYLVIPVIRTLLFSFMDANSQNFVGLDNYVYAFTNRSMLEAFRNNLLWLVIGTSLSVGLGLLIAVLLDRTNAKFEILVKSLIFLPMAISFVGAGVIWKFMYEFRPAGAEQIGLLNAILTGLGGQPQPWLITRPGNTYFLIIILVWLQTGYAMVIQSAAIKGVPSDLLEAGRIDGASEVQVFFRILIPTIRGTIITVATTVLILTLKVFDIVFTMTGGNFGTEVIANQFYVQMFRSFQAGRGAAIAMVLLIATIPIIYYNLRQARMRQEGF